MAAIILCLLASRRRDRQLMAELRHSCDRLKSTQRSRWRFSGRLTAPPCQRPFAELIARVGCSYNGHSLVRTDGRDQITTERPLQ